MGDELLTAPYIEPCPSYAGYLVRGYGNGIMGDACLGAASEAANASFEGMSRIQRKRLRKSSPSAGMQKDAGGIPAAPEGISDWMGIDDRRR